MNAASTATATMMTQRTAAAVFTPRGGGSSPSGMASWSGVDGSFSSAAMVGSFPENGWVEWAQRATRDIHSDRRIELRKRVIEARSRDDDLAFDVDDGALGHQQGEDIR